MGDCLLTAFSVLSASSPMALYFWEFCLTPGAGPALQLFQSSPLPSLHPQLSPWPSLSLSGTARHSQTFDLSAFPSLPSLPLSATPAQKILLHPATPSSSVFSRKFPKLSFPGLPWCFISVSWSGGGSMVFNNGKTVGTNKLDWMLVAVLGSGDAGGSRGGAGTLELCSCYTTETLSPAFPVLAAYYLWPRTPGGSHSWGGAWALVLEV